MAFPFNQTASDPLLQAPAAASRLVASLARRAPAIAPDTPLSDVCEMLRVSPYRMLPVVEQHPYDPDRRRPGMIIGVVTDKSLTEALVFSETYEDRNRLQSAGTARDVMTCLEPVDCALLQHDERHLCAVLDRARTDAIPVIDSIEHPYYLGMVSRSDLVRDLIRPFQPPMIGGMATPLGVYLTDGVRSGGVGTIALAATGLVTVCLHIAGGSTLIAAGNLAGRFLPDIAQGTHWLPRAAAVSVSDATSLFVPAALFLVLLRQTPIAGYHAAEHQVVHAIERGAPLLPENIRMMPRVHPRCSTNMVAGVLIFFLIGAALSPFSGPEVSYLAGAIGAFLWWKRLGSWLQQYATTRPASDRQIESGILAAKELLSRQDEPIQQSGPRFLGMDRYGMLNSVAMRVTRIWRMGFIQIILGYGLGLGLFQLLRVFFPPLRAWAPDIIG